MIKSLLSQNTALMPTSPTEAEQSTTNDYTAKMMESYTGTGKSIVRDYTAKMMKSWNGFEPLLIQYSTTLNTWFSTLGTHIYMRISGDNGTTWSAPIPLKTDNEDPVFDEDILISIENGKTFGKYANRDVIQAIGKTSKEVIIDACHEALVPSVSLSFGTCSLSFGLGVKTVKLNLGYTINTMGASVSSVKLEYYGKTGWETLSEDVDLKTYTLTVDDAALYATRFKTGTLNFRYTVTDTAEAHYTSSNSVSRQSYSAPTMSIPLYGNISSPETQIKRERGNVQSAPSVSITSRHSLVAITGWKLERYVFTSTGSSVTTLLSDDNLNVSSVATASKSDAITTYEATKITYKLTVTDQYTVSTYSSNITFKSHSFFGIVSGVLTAAKIAALNPIIVNSNFPTSSEVTVYDVSNTYPEYAVYAFPSEYPLIDNVIISKEGVPGWWIHDASPKLMEITRNNVSTEYRVYISPDQTYVSSDIEFLN